MCYNTLGSALGYSNDALKCKNALSYSDKYKKVEDFCKRSCNKCGKFILKWRSWIENVKMDFDIEHQWSKVN